MRQFTIILGFCLSALLFFIAIACNLNIVCVVLTAIMILNIFIAGTLAAEDFDKMQNKIADMEAEIEILKQENKNGN